MIVRQKALRLLALLLIIACQAGVSWLFLNNNGFFDRPPTTEDALRRLHAARMHERFEIEPVVSWPRVVYEYRHTHGPGQMVGAALVAFTTGGEVTERTLWLTMAIFGAVFSLGVYRLATNFVSKKSSILLVAVTQGSFIVIASHRGFYPQWPMASILVWSLDALVRSRGFRKMGPSLAFGITLGLATLTKVIAPLYVIGAVLVSMADLLKKDTAGTRINRTRNALLGLMAFLMVLMPWLIPNWKTIRAYEAEVTSQENVIRYEYSEVLSMERWSYYPLNVVNNGLGAFLALISLLCAVCLIFRISRVSNRMMQPDPNRLQVAGLAASVALSYIILTLKKPTDFSQYAVSWVPILLLPVAFIHDLAARRQRYVLVGALLLVLVFHLIVALRPMHRDNAHLRVGPIEWIPCVDRFITAIPRALQVRDSQPFEDWNLQGFTEAILSAFADRVPRIATLHPILNGANVQWEAERRGRRVRESLVPWEGIFRGTATGEFLLGIDALIVDAHNPLLRKEMVVAFLRSAGLHVEVSLEHMVFPDRDPVSLLIVRKPWERDRILSSDEWVRRKEVHRESILFQSGSELLGWEILTPPLLSGRTVLHTYWKSTQPALVVVVDSDGALLNQSRIDPDVTSTPAKNSLTVSSMEFGDSDRPRLHLYNLLRTQRMKPVDIDKDYLDSTGAVMLNR